MVDKRCLIYANAKEQGEGGGFTYLDAVTDYLSENGFILDWPENENQVGNTNRWLAILGRILKERNNYQVVLFKSNYIPSFTLNSNAILLVDFPFKNNLNWLDKLKLTRIRHIVCNSIFTAQAIKKYWNVKAEVLYPPTMLSKNSWDGKKNKIILTVGRFVNSNRAKRQDVLIEAFKTLCARGLLGYRLVLAGYVQDEQYIDSLKQLSENYPIDFYPNVSRAKLIDLYEDSMFYWHACGYQVNSDLNPEHVEHFGIAVADALAFGCIPFIYGNGGPLEIIESGKCGEVWMTKQELIQKTEMYCSAPILVNAKRKIGLMQSQLFSLENFENKLDFILADA